MKQLKIYKVHYGYFSCVTFSKCDTVLASGKSYDCESDFISGSANDYVSINQSILIWNMRNPKRN